jgi:hypothetical protein
MLPMILAVKTLPYTSVLFLVKVEYVLWELGTDLLYVIEMSVRL